MSPRGETPKALRMDHSGRQNHEGKREGPNGDTRRTGNIVEEQYRL